MDFLIRKMQKSDKNAVIDMMRGFYASPAVLTNGSEEIFNNDIENCINDSPYLEGYVFEDNGEILGYSMLAKSFSTEFGKPCIWIEDIFILEQYRHNKIGTKFFDFIFNLYPNHIFRLEAEEENHNAINLYKKCGFSVLPYLELKR